MPVGAPRDLHVRITTPTSAHATWTGVPNTRESIRGKLLGYKVLSQLCGNCRSTFALAMGLKVENLGRVAQRPVRIAIPRSLVLGPRTRIQTTANSLQYRAPPSLIPQSLLYLWPCFFCYHFLFHLLYFVYIVSLIFISLFEDLMHNFHLLLLYVLILLLVDCRLMNYFKMNDKQSKKNFESVFFLLLRESFSFAL